MSAGPATSPPRTMPVGGMNQPPMSQGLPPLPPGLTREHAMQLYQKWQQMKAEGAQSDNPEFVKITKTLQAISQHNEALKQRAAYQQHLAQQQQQKQQQQQQQQQQLLSPQQNGTPVAPPAATSAPPAALNGTGSNPSSAPSGLPAGSPATQPTPTNNTQSVIPTDAKSSAAKDSQSLSPNNPPSMAPNNSQSMGQNGYMNAKHKTMVRNQLKAFQLLSKNMPLSQDLQRDIRPNKQSLESTVDDIPTATESEVATANKTAVQPSQLPFSKRSKASKKYAPSLSSLYMNPRINYTSLQHRHSRPNIPSIMPIGVDPERVREERENIVYNRMKLRKEELASIDPNIEAWRSDKSDQPIPDGSRKLRALIEYKKLSLVEKQRVLRQAIGREVVLADTLAMTANRPQYRRQKKHDIREARFTEQLERDQRSAREDKEKQKHTTWLNKIKNHAMEVRTAANDQNERIKRLGRLMMDQHKTIEKEEQKRVERTARQRLQALKANDEETYMKLLGQAKDSRISHLLKQTDGFLKQLAASVKDQQRSATERWGRKDDDEDEELESLIDSEDEDDNVEGKTKVDYYDVAHKIKEEVTQQSSNLVGGLLKEYQIRGLQWMISLYNNNLNGILADEMGLGKTIQTISLITYLIEKKKQFGPFLVIVPLSTLTNWNNEFEKWAPSVQRIIYKGSPPVRKNLQNQIRYGNFQVLLTTYEFIIKDRPVLSKIRWLHMIVDEGHRMKNSQSKLSSTITAYYTTRYRLILTGTPLQNNLPELWSLLNFVLPSIFKSVKSFDEWFNTPFANTGGQDKMDLTEEEQLLVIRRLHKVLRPFLLRRLKKDVEKDLPDKQERVIKCSFSSLQAKLYKQLVSHNRLLVSDGKGGKTGVRGLSNMLMQLRKLCNHPFVFEEVEDQVNPDRLSNDLLWRCSGKFELLDRILPKFKATGHRILMFFQMTQIMNIMEDFMRLRGFSYLRLDGSTKSDERADLLKEFNAEGSPYFCFLLSTRAGGLGLNLQTADTVVIFDSDWNPHQDLQAQDRAHRIGQKNEVRILRLISSKSVEEKILERAQFKLDMDGKVIQAGKFDHKSTNEERDAMLRVMLESADAAENLEEEEMDDDDLNMIMMRSDDELEVFQKIDADRAKNDVYGPDKKLPRLLGENELPEIYVNEDNPVVDEVEEAFGRGARERTRVRYDDGLTEEQWLDAVDNDEDTIEDAIARKTEKIARRQANKDKRSRLENGVADSPQASRESSESPAPKKRGRKPKRKLDEISVDGDNTPDPSPAAVGQPPKKRGRQAKPHEMLSLPQREALQKSLDVVYETVEDLQEPYDPSDIPPGMDESEAMRPLIDPFMKLPDKRLYPDYYQFIKDPICMEQILKRINEKRYQGLDTFARDIKLLVDNCRVYNDDGSQLFKDAGTIEEKALELLRNEAKSHPELGAATFHEDQYHGQPSDGSHIPRSVTGPESAAEGMDGSVDGTGTGAASTSRSGTPASGFVTATGTKLKLNFSSR